MRAGALDHYAYIKRPIQMGRTAAGAQNTVFHTFVEAYCEKKSRRGKEHFDQATKQRVAQVVFQFRFRRTEVEGVDHTMQVVSSEDNQIYLIQSILPDDDRNEDVIIECILFNGHVGHVALTAFLEQSIPVGKVGVPYAATINASGGVAPYTFSLAAGALPAGLALDPATGIIFGTPTVAIYVEDVIIGLADVLGASTTLPPITISIEA